MHKEGGEISIPGIFFTMGGIPAVSMHMLPLPTLKFSF